MIEANLTTTNRVRLEISDISVVNISGSARGDLPPGGKKILYLTTEQAKELIEQLEGVLK